MPTFTVIAGPNGSGKSTLTKWNRESLQSSAILDPDAIARSLHPESGAASGSAIDAGTAVLLMPQTLLRNVKALPLRRLYPAIRIAYGARSKSSRICTHAPLRGHIVHRSLYDNSTSFGFTKVAVKSHETLSLNEPSPAWAEFLRTL